MANSVVTIHQSAEALRDDDLYNDVSINFIDFTELVAVVAILPFEMQGTAAGMTQYESISGDYQFYASAAQSR